MAEKKKESKAVSFDLGFGGLFQGLGNLVDALSELAEKGEQIQARTGEFKVESLGKEARGVYGFSIRTDIGGLPKVEHFGNIHPSDEGLVVGEVREPLVDIFDEGDEVVVVVELPGVSEEDIKIEIKDDILSLETVGDRRYAKEILLPQAVQMATLQQAYKNGILELRVKKA